MPIDPNKIVAPNTAIQPQDAIAAGKAMNPDVVKTTPSPSDIQGNADTTGIMPTGAQSFSANITHKNVNIGGTQPMPEGTTNTPKQLANEQAIGKTLGQQYDPTAAQGTGQFVAPTPASTPATPETILKNEQAIGSKLGQVYNPALNKGTGAFEPPTTTGAAPISTNIPVDNTKPHGTGDVWNPTTGNWELPGTTHPTGANANINSIIDSLDPNKQLTPDQRNQIYNAMNTVDPTTGLTVAQKGADYVASTAKQIVSDMNLARDTKRALDEKQAAYEAQVADVKREAALSMQKQLDNIKSTENNMSIILGTSGRLQSQNANAAAEAAIRQQNDIYNNMVSSRDSTLAQMAAQFQSAKTTIENNYTDQMTQARQDMLNTFASLDKTGAINTANGFQQAQSAIQKLLQANVANTMNYANTLKVLNDSYTEIHKQTIAQKTPDTEVTKTINDGFMKNAQGQTILDSAGHPMAYNRTKELDKTIQDPTTGDTIAFYRDGTHETLFHGSPASQSMITGYVNMIKLDPTKASAVIESLKATPQIQSAVLAALTNANIQAKPKLTTVYDENGERATVWQYPDGTTAPYHVGETAPGQTGGATTSAGVGISAGGFQQGMNITRTGGNVGKDTNNPGNITADSIPADRRVAYGQSIGAVGTYSSPNGRTYYVFPDMNTGLQASIKDISSKIAGGSSWANPNMSLSDFIKGWTIGPNAKGGPSQGYLAQVMKATGASANTPIGQINPTLLAQGIANGEGVNTTKNANIPQISAAGQPTTTGVKPEYTQVAQELIDGKTKVSDLKTLGYNKNDIKSIQNEKLRLESIKGGELSKDEETLVQALKSYDLDPNKLPGGMSKEAQASKKRILAAAFGDPSYDMKKYPAKQALYKSWTSGPMANNNNAITTVTRHMMELKPALEALQNKDFQKFNQLWNAADTQFGVPETNDAAVIAQAVGSEMAKVYKGNASPTTDEINEWSSKINTALSSKQATGLLGTLSKLLYGKVTSNAQNYARTMGEKPKSIFDPESEKFLRKNGVNISKDFQTTGTSLDTPTQQQIQSATPKIIADIKAGKSLADIKAHSEEKGYDSSYIDAIYNKNKPSTKIISTTGKTYSKEELLNALK